MTETNPCTAARETIQDLFDGPVSAGRRESLDGHLAGCRECRDARAGLDTVRAALQAMPEIPLPDDALDEVWARTVRATSDEASSWGWGWKPAMVLAASILLTAMVVLWSQRIEPTALPAVAENTYTDEQIDQARAELRQVMAITAGAFDRSRHAAFDRVIEGEVSPAIRRIPIHWPESGQDDPRRSKT